MTYTNLKGLASNSNIYRLCCTTHCRLRISVVPAAVNYPSGGRRRQGRARTAVTATERACESWNEREQLRQRGARLRGRRGRPHGRTWTRTQTKRAARSRKGKAAVGLPSHEAGGWSKSEVVKSHVRLLLIQRLGFTRAVRIYSTGQAPNLFTPRFRRSTDSPPAFQMPSSPRPPTAGAPPPGEAPAVVYNSRWECHPAKVPPPSLALES